MLCHGSCGAQLPHVQMFTRRLFVLAKEAGIKVLALEEFDLRNGMLCPDCALFRKECGEYWQTFADAKKVLGVLKKRVRVVGGKILLPKNMADKEALSAR